MGVRFSPGMPKQAPPANRGVAPKRREITAGDKIAEDQTHKNKIRCRDVSN